MELRSMWRDGVLWHALFTPEELEERSRLQRELSRLYDGTQYLPMSEEAQLQAGKVRNAINRIEQAAIDRV